MISRFKSFLDRFCFMKIKIKAKRIQRRMLYVFFEGFIYFVTVMSSVLSGVAKSEDPKTER